MVLQRRFFEMLQEGLLRKILEKIRLEIISEEIGGENLQENNIILRFGNNLKYCILKCFKLNEFECEVCFYLVVIKRKINVCEKCLRWLKVYVQFSSIFYIWRLE